MPSPLKLNKADVARALVRYHFSPAGSQKEVFDRLRSIQFDPIAPVGCNHDLVLQARLADYRVGDWQKVTYQDRQVYDGWDKQASLVRLEGWPLRRLYHALHEAWFEKLCSEHGDAVNAILKELEERGPMMPKECAVKERRDDWEDSWYGPSVAKRVFRALWHSGRVMTSGRRSGHHIYDLTDRVVPAPLLTEPLLEEREAVIQLFMERHRAMGIIRPVAPFEVWSYRVSATERHAALKKLVNRGELCPVEVDGVSAHATPEFLSELDQPALNPRVIFVAPLDQFMWDRKMTSHVFGFDYIWEIYTPEAKRRWGYYVLPVLFGDALVGRVEFWARKGVLEIRKWHWDVAKVPRAFWPEFERALRRFMKYCGAKRVEVVEGVDAKVADLAATLSLE